MALTDWQLWCLLLLAATAAFCSYHALKAIKTLSSQLADVRARLDRITDKAGGAS